MNTQSLEAMAERLCASRRLAEDTFGHDHQHFLRSP